MPSWASADDHEMGAASATSATAATAAAAPGLSPLERARQEAMDEAPQTVHEADDSAVSDDDEDVEEAGEVGIPVVERLLGGTVIRDEQS